MLDDFSGIGIRIHPLFGKQKVIFFVIELENDIFGQSFSRHLRGKLF